VSTRIQVLVRESEKMAEKVDLYQKLVRNRKWKKHLCAISKMDIQFDKLDNNVCSLAMDVKELENDLDEGYEASDVDE
jgi:hypothetical protein